MDRGPTREIYVALLSLDFLQYVTIKRTADAFSGRNN